MSDKDKVTKVDEDAIYERIMAAVKEQLDEKDKKIEILEEQLKNPYTDNEGKGNPNVMLYEKGKGLEGRQFPESEVPSMLKKGWLETPDLSDEEKKATEPNPAPGEVVKGKVFKG